MGLLDHFKKSDKLAEEEYAEDLARETAKVKAYRTADEVADAARKLMIKALELREEIEAMSDE